MIDTPRQGKTKPGLGLSGDAAIASLIGVTFDELAVDSCEPSHPAAPIRPLQAKVPKRQGTQLG
jgi:hypothetical protein